MEKVLFKCSREKKPISNGKYLIDQLDGIERVLVFLFRSPQTLHHQLDFFILRNSLGSQFTSVEEFLLGVRNMKRNLSIQEV